MVVAPPTAKVPSGSGKNLQLSREFRSDIAQLVRKHGREFKRKPELKPVAERLFHVLLPPRPKRGRPRDAELTRAITLRRRFRRKHPGERPDEIWHRVCQAIYFEYVDLDALAQKDIRDDLRSRVKSRFRSRRGRKSR